MPYIIIFLQTMKPEPQQHCACT